ncbi:MAG: cysteine desulfurase family protein [Candidatus Tumulicola sp.]
MNRHSFQRIYLDHAASAPLKTEVIDAMQAAHAEAGFNPSSTHAEGRRTRAVLDDARERIAAALGASRSEIRFTGSGTEAGNLAVLGAVRAGGGKSHVVTSAIEHHAVLHALNGLPNGECEVTVLPVDECGRLDPARFADAIRSDTVLASIAYANNEVGTVAPIAALAEIAHRYGVLFHTDAVQAPGWLPIDVKGLGVDLLSLSAHKFCGPKGVGVLYVRNGTPISALIAGGGQEFGLRSGTENVAGIAGAATALELATADRTARAPQVGALRDRLERGILATISGVRINAAEAPRLPNLASVTFDGVDTEALLMRLDLEGVAASAGSACASGAQRPSHVLAAMHSETGGHATVRFSLGTATTQAEIDRVLTILPAIVRSLRRPAATPA